MEVTAVDLVTRCRLTGVNPCSSWSCWEVSCTTNGKETTDVKEREGETEIGISSSAKEEEGSLVCWAKIDNEQV